MSSQCLAILLPCKVPQVTPSGRRDQREGAERRPNRDPGAKRRPMRIVKSNRSAIVRLIVGRAGPFFANYKSPFALSALNRGRGELERSNQT